MAGRTLTANRAPSITRLAAASTVLAPLLPAATSNTDLAVDQRLAAALDREFASGDYAGLVSAPEARSLDDKLRAFDQETSTQVVVAVFPELPSPSLEDFPVRTAQSWRVGQKTLDNGAILFVFVKDRKLRVEVGYGLEGALPDALAKRIIADTIAPAFKSGAHAQGLSDGIAAIMAATRGEYQAPPAARP